MRTNQETLLDVLGAPETQFVIPVYQRVYAWTGTQCDMLWSDICRAGRTESAHFMGTILLGEEEGDDGLRRINVVDGQQRLATITLLIAAIRDHLRETGAECVGTGDGAVTADDLMQRYLSSGEASKLQLSLSDCTTLDAIIASTALPEDEEELSGNVVANYENFRERISASGQLEQLWEGLRRLRVVNAWLEPGDKPQLVFESLNSKGMPLSTLDLVRNLLLLGLDLDEQQRLYEEHWLPVENMFADDPDSTRFSAALRGWLAIKAPKLCRGGEDSYATLKAFIESGGAPSVEDLLFGLKGFCQTFSVRSQSSGARIADAHNSYGVAKVEGIISEKKLFGD